MNEDPKSMEPEEVDSDGEEVQLCSQRLDGQIVPQGWPRV